MAEVQYTPTMYEEIMKNSPTMRVLVEGKIAEEIAKKQAEIDESKAKNAQLEQENVSIILALTEVYEQLLLLQGGTV